jgi:D-3-phosphoglycerate dehydrogenase / 2-oxoglutarate reductase
VTVLVLDEGYTDDVLGGLDAVRGTTLAGDDVRGLLVDSHIPVRAEDLRRLPRLLAVATASVGFDHVDVEAASGLGVWVCNVPDYCTEEVADTAVAYVFALVRGIVALDRSVRSGVWDSHGAGALGRVARLRVGVVGFGRIGRAFAARMSALGCEVWANDPFVGARELETAGVRAADLPELLGACDVVSLHVPLTEDTRGLIGEAELASMRPTAVLLNTARGPVVDVDALVAALRAGRLGGAALDVLPVEPPPAPLDAPGLVVTPHAAWYSPAAERARYAAAADAVRLALSGVRPPGAVNVPARLAQRVPRRQ